ncbi:unnamed protein product (macronuclear) [Paramecium tetraurelia]|uniref:Protein kinase domain-containing protein n=1 Tax=Paramecium tetraurelia TaxID=5888 RepID=A0E3C0_PARTE|nr:uncharacterized protein GSPATT00022960001 [Paramecium tetraurelia]CAK89787.1 unnamed protein product [Paramecium tetraurelia]|eukprot:XP_001457184.1 hypothetical protein (macronuclear) [Paramecium tetraurelia strain d4-2]
MLYHMYYQLSLFSFEIEIQLEQNDNWEMQMKEIKELWNAFESKLKLPQKPNFLQVVKNRNEQCILEMMVSLLQAIIHSPYSSELVTPMMQLDQETQMVLLKLIQEEQSSLTLDQESKISDEVLRKFEELEYENQKLNQDLMLSKEQYEMEKKKMKEDMEIVQTDIETRQKTINSLNEDLNQIYEVTQTNSVSEVCEYIHNRIDDIKGMQQIIETLKNDQQQEKDVHEEIVRDLRNKLEAGYRKYTQMQKLEKYCEQLKTQLSESLQEQTKNKENLKQNSKLKEENIELNNKVNQLQQKLDSQKQLQKQNQKIQSQQEFDISKARSENESLSRQLKLREQEIFKLKQEIIDLEHNIHNKTEQSQLENSSVMLHSLNDGEERRNFSGIFTPKRNLGLELSQLITKSNYLIEGDQKLKLDVHTQTDDNYESFTLLKKQDSSFDEEILSSQLSFWKTQCSDLLAERALYEEKQNQLHKEMKELQIKLEQFFIEQHKYEQELQDAKDKVLSLIEDNNVIRSQFEQSLQKIALQDKQLVEFPQMKEQLEGALQKLEKTEEQLRMKKKKKVPINQSSRLMRNCYQLNRKSCSCWLHRSKIQSLIIMFPKSCDELYQCRLFKKLFLGSSTRYFYVFSDRVIANKDSNRKRADRIFSNTNTNRLIWRYTNEQPLKLKGLIFDCGDIQFEYFGEDQTLRELKKNVSNLFFQAKVQEEYMAQQVIGQGNYALVLELQHLHSDQRFASKCIDKKKVQAIEQGEQSVQNEIKIMRTLSPHRSLINLIEVYEGDNNIYLIMDLAQGGSLYKEMKNKVSLYSREEVQNIMYQILSGLHYIHSKQIMHRDLKPENILFREKGNLNTLTIADFGLSVEIDAFPYLYPKCGTPGFVAPEVANLIDKTQPYTAACDIFSAGVIFHILLLGEGLFVGNGHQEILRMNKEFQVDFSKPKYQQLDYDAKDLLFKMTAHNFLQRYTSEQCLQHPFFQNNGKQQSQQKTTQFNTSQIEESPNKDSFNQYLQNYNSPNQKLISQDSKKLSIVTRTPLYGPKAVTPQVQIQNDILEELSPLSHFSLDQEQQGEQEYDNHQIANTK